MEVAHKISGYVPRTARKTAKAETRRIILKTARRMFIEQNYEQVTLRSVAAGYGKSTGSLFSNFTGKEELFAEVATEELQAYEDAAAGWFSRRGQPNTGNFGSFVVSVLSIDYALERQALLRIEASVSWAGTPGETMIDRRKEYLRNLLLAHYAYERAVRTYLNFAWAFHLEGCRESLDVFTLKSRMEAIEPSLREMLSLP